MIAAGYAGKFPIRPNDGYAVRRRTEAFEWDKELYRQWNGGGSCWLDRDPNDGDGGSFAAMLHISCTIAATAANENGVPGASVSCNGTDIDNNSVLREGDLLQNRNYTATQQPGLDTQQCLHNPQFAANENRSPPKPAGTENIAPQHPPIDCCNCSKPAANVQQNRTPLSGPGITNRLIHLSRRPPATLAGRKAPGMWRNLLSSGRPGQRISRTPGGSVRRATRRR